MQTAIKSRLANLFSDTNIQILRGIYRRAVLGLAAACLLSTPVLSHTGSGIAVDRSGQVFFLDTGSGLWKINTKGGLTHLSGLRNHWLAIDEKDGFTQDQLPTDPALDWKLTKVGSNPAVLISTDWPLAIGQDGNLYYQSGRPGHLQIVRTVPSGGSSVFATVPKTTAGASLPHINGITAGPDNSIYYTGDNSIYRINAEGKISTVATVPALARGPSIPGTSLHPYLRGLNVDANGVVYVADNGDARVLKITPEGKITTLVQLESPWSPTSVALFGDVLYVLEFLHTPNDDRLAWVPRIRKITPDGKSSVILTVDQMPGARPKPVSSVMGMEYFDVTGWLFSNPFLEQPVRNLF